MAKFAATYLIEESLPPLKLTKEQISQIYADQALELEQIQKIGSDSSRIGEAVLKGSATSKDFDVALRNQYQSGIKPSSTSKQEVVIPLFDEDDESFLAQLYRSLVKIK